MRAVIAVALLGITSVAAAQQVNVASPARLRVTTTSEEASRHFFAGLTEARHFFTSKAAMHFDAAIAADQNLGLARVVRAATVPGPSQMERTAEVNRAVAAMQGATTSEMLVALAIRDGSNQEQEQSHALWETAAKLMPGDPNVAFYAALTAPSNGDPEPMRAVTERFPDDAPSFNILAYQLWLRGDHDGGFKAVRRYMELAPDHPNAHDSYAELLQWSGRLTEAQAHYSRAAQLDSSFSEAFMGLAEIATLSGKGAEARRQIQLAIAHSPSKTNTIFYTRDLARSFLLDGMLKEGMDQFAIALRDAQALNRPRLIAQIHQDMAIADAQSGRGTTIASHLAAAAQANGAEDPMQIEITAAANALGGDTNVARQAIQKLTALAQPDNQYATRTSVMRALIALRANKPTEALTQLAGAPLDDSWVRTLTAECYAAAGNLADARTLKNQVLNDPQLNFDDGYNVAARIRAAKIKA